MLEKLSTFIENKTAQEGLNSTVIPFVKLFKSSDKTPVLNTVYEPSLFIIAQGAKIVMLGNNTIEYDRSSYLISTMHLPVSGKIIEAQPHKPFLSVQVTFDMELIFELLGQRIQKPINPLQTTLAISSYHVRDQLLDAVIRLVELIQTPDDIEILAPLYHKEILYMLLMNDKHAEEFRQLACLEGNAYKISQAISMMRANLFEPLSVLELANSVNMSISTFHKHFKTMIAMSPMQYRKVQRLQEAKRLMVSENMDVSGAAFYVGYESVSQFSREYSKYFGLSPSQDMKILRQRLNTKDL
ncbi:MAG: AraC family transcriptional regulator [Thiovulaceae bacterium]|nr:AraC family transcriptional regulator [Sulfurimonadaceae bacterium]